MTREQFVDKYRHEISGEILDVLCRDAKGAELSMAVRAMLRRIDTMLGAAYDSLKVATNGTPNPVRTDGRKP